MYYELEQLFFFWVSSFAKNYLCWFGGFLSKVSDLAWLREEEASLEFHNPKPKL